MRRLSSLLMLAAVLGVTAKADIVVNLTGGPTAVANGYRWDYTAGLETNDLVDGSFFAIYDFPDFVEEVSATRPSNWTFTAELDTDQGTGLETKAPDNPTMVNLRWTYTGPTVDLDPGEFVSYGPFSVISSTNTARNLWFSAKTWNSDFGEDARNIGQTDGPGGGGDEVPEPGSMMLLGGGLGALLYIRRRRAA